ncbi:MAG: hypothetical protein JWO40_789 [Candidatus Doudnabacteria bacterium]|nr:hypothetical protein [Candidatus Doudnabacteria bacterium]
MKKFIFVAAVLLTAAGCSNATVQQSNNQTASNTQPDISQVQNINTDANRASEDVVVRGTLHRYTSYKLGVTFTYVNDGQQVNTKVKEIGDTIYVYYADLNADPLKGQSIQVYKKDLNTSLETAIANQTKADLSQCEVKVVDQATGDFSGPAFPSTYVQAFVSDKTGKYSFPELNPSCSHYQASNSVAYFLMDKNKPDKYAYVSVGQYAILGDDQNESVDWASTIRFR